MNSLACHFQLLMHYVYFFAGLVSIFGKSGYSEKIYTSFAPLRLASTTQCSESDKKLWTGTQSNQFFSNIRSCTSQSVGSSDMTTDVSNCLKNIYADLSSGCSTCFGEDVDCGATNCRVPCQEASSTSCQKCLQPCTQSLVSCTGTTNLPSDSSKQSDSHSTGTVFTATGLLIASVVLMFV
jgi:hypothetical protein